MCVTDTSDKHVLSVWDWEKERMIAKTTVSIHYRSVGTTRYCFFRYQMQSNHEKYCFLVKLWGEMF